MRIAMLLLCCSTFFLASCGSAPKKMTAKPDFSGTWGVTVQNTPLGTVSGDLILMKAEDGKFSGKFSSGGKEMPLKSVTTTEESVTVSFYYPDYDLDVVMKLDGPPAASALVGQTLGEYMTTATRK